MFWYQIFFFLLQIFDIFAQLSQPITSKFKCLPNGCCDEHEWCRFWASIGECEANSEWMLVNCQLACNSCPTDLPLAPESTQSENAKCELIRTNPNIADELKLQNLINPFENVFLNQLLSVDDIIRSAAAGCVPKLMARDCSLSLCYHLSYRTYDGVCNNLNRPLQGAAFQPFLRILPPVYDDGISEPVSSLRLTRPSSREASRLLLASAQSIVHDKFNTLIMQWGQFISHDVAKTTLQPSTPCKTCSPVPSKCMTIMISPNDRNMEFRKRGCLKISRSAPVCGTGRHPLQREQLNENTAFIDASPIYGSSLKDLSKFRDGRSGFLKMTRFNNQLVLPFDQSKCTSPDKCTVTFTAGDIRVNLFIGLSSMHILFAREHNRIAAILQRQNPNWSGDRLFQEARKIVGAEVQIILYKEFLPKVLGNSMAQVIGPYNGYDPQVDPTISNVFTSAAYRFGHGMLEEFYRRIDFRNVSHEGYMFSDGIFKSKKILFEGGIDPILRGFMMTPVKRPHRMTLSITEKMFGSTDLGSVNIQRGRDHGLPSYNHWRQYCGKPLANDFEGLRNEILEKNIRDALKRTYRTPNDIDLYIGSMVEDPVIGGLVGPTLACLVGEQFKRLRDGDRFYYENPGVFTSAQLQELRKITLANVICNNADNFQVISEDAFLLPQGNSIPCSSLPTIDLTKWKD